MQNPTAAPSSEPLPAEKSPIKAAMPPTMKPITANAQFNALLPLTIVIVLRSRIAPDRGGFSTAGRRTGMRAPRGQALVRKARGNVALGVFAANVSQRALADFRVRRGIVVCAVRCRRTVFCTVMLFTGECALRYSSDRIDAGTDVDLSQNDACPIRPDAKPHVQFAALLRTSPARDARRCWPCAYCAAAIAAAARRTGLAGVSYLRKRLS
ncbi:MULTISPECIES: hypothetical protein [unclassified Burkholderia]|uniref:hypothetical protein n=1 Tax=unclassified Burkholderia TaxID=2613784 RepID=UPI00211B502C|nr:MULTISPECIES: hypothetical protein [unclassified Burkholderia]MDN7429839.1 hypothetical protein [Burkholderia sp. AU45388]